MSKITHLDLAPPPPSAEAMAESDRLTVLEAVRGIDSLIIAAINKATEGLADQDMGRGRTLLGGLDQDLAKAAATWVQVRRGLIDSHPGLMSVQGVTETPDTMTDDELAAAIYEELTG